MILPNFPTKACAVVAGVVGSWTLTGVLSGLASLVAIIVGLLHVYDWIQKKRREKK
jgi:hypothetical protein